MSKNTLSPILKANHNKRKAYGTERSVNIKDSLHSGIRSKLPNQDNVNESLSGGVLKSMAASRSRNKLNLNDSQQNRGRTQISNQLGDYNKQFESARSLVISNSQKSLQVPDLIRETNDDQSKSAEDNRAQISEQDFPKP